uniref:Myb-binding protein 1A-like protein n=1 Tax=Phallusia mammillata TaxID=59560 RepID=A0A6F9DM82_9ASCI|nr:myb-binding protein 1A-like protein [Phallusia mammillata]
MLERDEKFMQVFWDLADNEEAKRIGAIQQLVKNLLEKQDQAEDPSELCPELKYAVGRLVQGLGSNRKCARIGFSAALTTLLKQVPSNLLDAKDVLDLMGEKLQLGNTKSEDREILFGRVFCLLSLIESEKLLEKGGKNAVIVHHVTKEFIRLSRIKTYMHKVAVAGLCELCRKVPEEVFEKAMWPTLSSCFAGGWETCTPDMLQLLLVCHKTNPDSCGKTFLKTNKWTPAKSKKAEIIGPHSFKHLARIVAETTPCQPVVDPFALEVIVTIAKQGSDVLGNFWSESLSSTLLTSSPERKCLAVKLACFSLPLLNEETLLLVWNKDLLMNLYHALMNKDHHLHRYCKEQLPKELSEKMSDVSPDVQYKFLFQLWKSPGGIHLDGITHASVVSTVVGHLKLPALLKYIKWLKKLFLVGTVGDVGIKEINLDVARTWSSSQLAHLVRMVHLPRNEQWITGIIKFLFLHGYFQVDKEVNTSKVEEVQMVDEHFTDLSEATQRRVRQSSASVITWLNNMLPINSKEDGASKKIPGLMLSGEFWLSMIVEYANKLMQEEGLSVLCDMDKSTTDAWNETMNFIKKMTKLKKDSKGGKVSEATAMQLLLLHVSIQLLSPDGEVQKSAVDVISDLRVIVAERFSKERKKLKMSEDNGPHWVEVIVEILLSMLSQGSHSVRVVADQVFKLISTHMTKKALNLITDVLIMKDAELMKNKDEEGDEDDTNEDDDMDQQEDEEMETSEDESDEEEIEEVAEDVDAEFRRKIKEALGNAAAPSDNESDDNENNDENESDSDDDMSDDAMMRIDPMLSNIFKERNQSKKAQKKNNKMHVTHFQLRCLDLIESFITRHHATNPMVLDLARPLLEVVDLASRDPDKSALAERATVILRMKLCKMKGYPHSLNTEEIAACHEDIEQILQKCQRTSGGLFLAQLCSHTCMFLLRVLCGNPAPEEGCQTGAADTGRVTSAYASALENFMTKRESHLHLCVLQDYVSRYPLLAKGLVEPLIRHIKNGVLVFRKTQACQLLMSLITCSISSQHAKTHSEKLLVTTCKVLENIISNARNVKTNYVSELLRLLFHASKSLKEQQSDYDWASTIQVLKNLLEMPEIQRSQNLTNLSWRAASLLGQTRPKVDKTEQRNEKRKRKEEKAKQAKENGEDATEESGEKKESRRELKRRIRKEKKLAKRQTQAKRKNEGGDSAPKKKFKKKNRGQSALDN